MDAVFVCDGLVGVLLEVWWASHSGLVVWFLGFVGLVACFGVICVCACVTFRFGLVGSSGCLAFWVL